MHGGRRGRPGGAVTRPARAPGQNAWAMAEQPFAAAEAETPAGPPARSVKQAGAGATTGARIFKAVKRQAARQAQAPKPTLQLVDHRRPPEVFHPNRHTATST